MIFRKAFLINNMIFLGIVTNIMNVVLPPLCEWRQCH